MITKKKIEVNPINDKKKITKVTPSKAKKIHLNDPH